MRFRPYQPDQAYLLPPSVAEVLGVDHLCFFLRRVVAQLDLSALERAYDEEGQPGYHPALLLSVWLYAYALGVTSSRRLEQRIREDLGFRYLAGGEQPDHWTLNHFRRRHPKALNDLFTQVVESARQAGLGRLGHVAIDSTRVKANAARVKALEQADSDSPPIMGMTAAFILDLKGYDPVAVAKGLPIHILVLQGERDFEITMKDFNLWKTGLAGRKETTFHSYPALNHLLIAGQGKSSEAEYRKPGHVAEEAVDEIAKWVAQ